jgi:uncharacterized membrane protein YdbT with pleckstrin-like domain
MGRYVRKHLMPGERSVFETRLSAWCYISMRSLLSLGLIPFIQRRTREYAVTNKRVIIKSGLIRVNSLELNLSKIESVAVHQSLTARILGYGSLAIRGTGGTNELFHEIDDPQAFRAAFQQAVDASVART